MTTRRPPGSRQAGACARKAASSSNSWFTAIRKAWKTRVAGCSLSLRPPGPWACSNNFTNCRVVWKGPPAAFFHHQAGDAPGPMLLAILPENPFQLRFQGTV